MFVPFLASSLIRRVGIVLLLATMAVVPLCSEAVASTAVVPARQSVSLIEATYTINGNGHLGDLVITSIDASGNLNGTVFGQPIIGFWDEDGQKITFMRIIDAGDPSKTQIYTGYRFRTEGGCEDGVGDVCDTLTGSFEAFSGTGGSADRSVYGWYAFAGIVT
jgi:hypothetical protein